MDGMDLLGALLLSKSSRCKIFRRWPCMEYAARKVGLPTHLHRQTPALGWRLDQHHLGPRFGVWLPKITAPSKKSARRDLHKSGQKENPTHLPQTPRQKSLPAPLQKTPMHMERSMANHLVRKNVCRVWLPMKDRHLRACRFSAFHKG